MKRPWKRGDPAPVGRKVQIRCGSDGDQYFYRTGEILGAYIPSQRETLEHPDCPSCKCPAVSRFAGMWRFMDCHGVESLENPSSFWIEDGAE